MDTATLNAYSWCKLPRNDTISDVHNIAIMAGLQLSASPCRIKPPPLQPEGLVCDGHLFKFRPLDIGAGPHRRVSGAVNHPFAYLQSPVDREMLITTLWRTINACHVAGLGQLARVLYMAAEMKDWKLYFPDDLSPQIRAEIRTTHPMTMSSQYREKHPWQIDRLLERLALGGVWWVATTAEGNEDTLLWMHIFWCLRPPSHELTRGDLGSMFVPERVLVEDESRNGVPLRLVYWDVKVQSKRTDIVRLECLQDLQIFDHHSLAGECSSFLERDMQGQPTSRCFFFGDPTVLAEGRGRKYLLK
jgi:hypothetical protein